MKLHNLLLFIFALAFLVPQGNALANVEISSCALENSSFGKISAGNFGSGTFEVKTNSAAGSSIGGDGKLIATGNNAVLTIETLGTGDALKVFLTNPNFAMTKNDAPPIAAKMSFSDNSPAITSFTTDSIISSNQATTKITIYGYSTINANQPSGNYSGNYDLTICTCTGKSCPATISDPRCSTTACFVL